MFRIIKINFNTLKKTMLSTIRIVILAILCVLIIGLLIWMHRDPPSSVIGWIGFVLGVLIVGAGSIGLIGMGLGGLL